MTFLFLQIKFGIILYNNTLDFLKKYGVFYSTLDVSKNMNAGIYYGN
jgi:hypothetical protein